jgi:hypothetical protein
MRKDKKGKDDSGTGRPWSSYDNMVLKLACANAADRDAVLPKSTALLDLSDAFERGAHLDQYGDWTGATVEVIRTAVGLIYAGLAGKQDSQEVINRLSANASAFERVTLGADSEAGVLELLRSYVSNVYLFGSFREAEKMMRNTLYVAMDGINHSLAGGLATLMTIRILEKSGILTREMIEKCFKETFMYFSVVDAYADDPGGVKAVDVVTGVAESGDLAAAIGMMGSKVTVMANTGDLPLEVIENVLDTSRKLGDQLKPEDLSAAVVLAETFSRATLVVLNDVGIDAFASNRDAAQAAISMISNKMFEKFGITFAEDGSLNIEPTNAYEEISKRINALEEENRKRALGIDGDLHSLDEFENFIKGLKGEDPEGEDS